MIDSIRARREQLAALDRATATSEHNEEVFRAFSVFMKHVGLSDPLAARPADVVDCLIWKVLVGKSKAVVHVPSCGHFRQPVPSEAARCDCPHRMAPSTIKTIRFALQAFFRDMGRTQAFDV